MATRKRWSELTPRQRTAVVVAGTIEVVLTTVALADLVRRPAAQVRGAKALWAVACFVQPVGPVAYLAVGRRASGSAPTDQRQQDARSAQRVA